MNRSTTSRVWLLLALVLSGCLARPAPHGAEARPLARIGTAPDVGLFLDADTRRASEAGAGPPIVVAVGAGAPGDRVSGVLAVPSGECTLLLARGAPSVDDIDLFAYGDDGTVLGADEASEKNAAILLCPPHPKHVYVVGRVASGHGLIAVSAQPVEPSRAERVGEGAGVGRRGEESVTLEAWPGLEEKLAAHRRAIGGKWQDDRRSTIPLDTRVATNVSALIEGAECLDALVVPSDEVSQVDVTVLDSDGRVSGRAATFGRDKSLVLCSPSRAVVTFEVRPHAGRGLAALLLSRSRDVDTVGATADVLRYDLVPIGPLSQQRATFEKRLPSDAGTPRTIGEGAAAVGSRTSIAFDLASGCSRIDVVLGAPARGVEAWLWSKEGALLAHAEGGADATLFTCSEARRVRLDLEAITRAGPFAAELRTEAGVAQLLSSRSLAAGRLSARLWSLGALRRFSDLRGAKAVRLSDKRLTRERATIRPGHCAVFALATEGGGSGAEIRVVDEKAGSELALVRGTNSAATRVCAPDAPGTPTAREVAVELRLAAGEADALFATAGDP